jgi:hypothetical protein
MTDEADTRGVEPVSEHWYSPAEVAGLIHDLHAEVAKRQEAEQERDHLKKNLDSGIDHYWVAVDEYRKSEAEVQRLREALEQIAHPLCELNRETGVWESIEHAPTIAAAALDRTPPGNTAPPTTLGEGGDLHWNVRTPEQ